MSMIIYNSIYLMNHDCWHEYTIEMLLELGTDCEHEAIWQGHKSYVIDEMGLLS